MANVKGADVASVFKHPKTGNVLLESVVNGKTVRLSTGKKATARMIGWYKAHAEEEFWKLYYEKHGTGDGVAFDEYAKLVVNITKANRNRFSQRKAESQTNKLIEYFGDTSLEKIRPSIIQAWQDSYLEKYKGKTVREFRSTLNAVFEMAVNDEIITRNPLRAVKAPKRVKVEVETFKDEERKLLIESAEGQLANIIQFAFFSGLRAGEITGLKWENVDFEKNKLNVCVRIRGGEEDLPKGGKVRVIDLLPQAKQALIAQMERTGLAKYVFLSRNGEPYYSEVSITQSIKTLCAKMGIEEGGLQKIRRSHNTMLKQHGLPIDWILHQMGHEKEEVNRTHYTGQINVDVSQFTA